MIGVVAAAFRSAFATSSVRTWSAIVQPTTFFKKQSMTVAREEESLPVMDVGYAADKFHPGTIRSEIMADEIRHACCGLGRDPERARPAGDQRLDPHDLSDELRVSTRFSRPADWHGRADTDTFRGTSVKECRIRAVRAFRRPVVANSGHVAQWEKPVVDTSSQ